MRSLLQGVCEESARSLLLGVFREESLARCLSQGVSHEESLARSLLQGVSHKESLAKMSLLREGISRKEESLARRSISCVEACCNSEKQPGVRGDMG